VPQKATATSTVTQQKAISRLTIVLPQDVANRLEALHDTTGIPKVRLITNSLIEYLPAMEKLHA
jgi:predicted DNA-binding protein